MKNAATMREDHSTNPTPRRTELEEETETAQASLLNWQLWSAEYEGLKEELRRFKKEPDEQQINNLAVNFEGTVLQSKEITDLFRQSSGSRRTVKQAIGVLVKRIEYAEQNVTTLEKRVAGLQEQLFAIKEASQLDMNCKDKFPIMEIIEELDEEGNVITGRASAPAEGASEVLEALQTAGVPVHENEDKPGKSTGQTTQNAQKVSPQTTLSNQNSSSTEDKSEQGDVSTKIEQSSSSDSSKPPVEYVGNPNDTRQKSDNSHVISSALASESTTQQRPNLKAGPEEDPIDLSKAIIPEDESPEDAALRRQMLEYNLNQLGPIVAEVDLEAGSNGDTEGSFDDEEEEEDVTDEEDEEDEDQWGRSTRREVTAEYATKMRELEKRLNAQMLENVGPDPVLPQTDTSKDTGIKPGNPQPTKGALKSSSKPKKGVRFSEELDIAPRTKTAPRPTKDEDVADLSNEVSEEPMVESIVEREIQTDPKILEDKLERQNVEMTNQELALEYHTIRNRMMKRQGGFMADEEAETTIVSDEDTSQPRVSRFKAARLKRQ